MLLMLMLMLLLLFLEEEIETISKSRDKFGPITGRIISEVITCIRSRYKSGEAEEKRFHDNHDEISQ